MQNLFTPTSPLAALLTVVIALISIQVIAKMTQFSLQPVRYEAIDGLRGYLAIFVFISHASIWYYFLQSDKWDVPPSKLFTHFGQASVCIFFMITSFLFSQKLASKSKIDWGLLFTSRVFRLFPLYLIFILALFIIVAFLSNFTQKEATLSIISEGLRWFFFTIKNDPHINGVALTKRIVSGVTWSLRYEWLFYISLPLLHIIVFKGKSPIYVIVLAMLALFIVARYEDFHLIYCFAFLPGIAATFLIKSKRIQQQAIHPFSTLFIILILIVLILYFPTSYSILPLSLVGVFFTCVACGNSIFGLLTSSFSRKIGQLSYGIYLFHGIFIFITFKFVVGFKQAAALSPLQYWLIIFALTPVIIAFSFFLHVKVELPAQRLTPIFTKKLHALIWDYQKKVQPLK